MTSPLVSVVICTHDRADRLDAAIRSVLRQDAPGVELELLVVDNASTDATARVVRARATDPRVRCLREPRLGLCHARNTGARAARGRYVAYLDDDAVAQRGWLAAIVRAFAIEPEPGIVGGRVTPLWEGTRPAWLSDDIALSLTIVDWSAAPFLIRDVRRHWLVGANLAVRKSVLESIGGFRSSLDRVGNVMLSGGDVFLQAEIIARGYPCLYEPAMAVTHAVPAARLAKRWFRRRYYWQGISDAVMRLIEAPTPPARRARLVLAALGGLVASPRALADALTSPDDPARFTRACFAWLAVGQLVGLLGGARR